MVAGTKARVAALLTVLLAVFAGSRLKPIRNKWQTGILFVNRALMVACSTPPISKFPGGVLFKR